MAAEENPRITLPADKKKICEKMTDFFDFSIKEGLTKVR
jgi:hypothetical protein